MSITKLHLGAFVITICTIAAMFVWQRQTATQLRNLAVRQSAITAERITALDKKIQVQSHRLMAAENRVGRLLDDAQIQIQSNLSTAASVRTRSVASIDSAEVVRATLAQASNLIADGKLADALELYIKTYRELQVIRPGSPECQQLMGVIKQLGRTYSPAISALTHLRDSAMVQWRTRPARTDIAFEVALLNEQLGESSRTLALYDALPPNDIIRQSLAKIARTSFIAARRYADALVGRPYGEMLNAIEHAATIVAEQEESRQATIRRSFIGFAVTDIEVLTGAGKLDDARVLTEKLLAFDNSEQTRIELKRHIDRAEALR